MNRNSLGRRSLSSSGNPITSDGDFEGLFFQEGRDVKKGDRLYQIDPVPFHAAI